MSYSDRKQEFSREPFKIVEIEVDYCQNDFGVSPCTATGSGDSKCYNTLASCQDVPNFIDEPKVYRFCEQRSPHPIGLEAIPSLRSISMAPAEIKIDGGLSVNASVSLTFDDHPASDIDTDKYVDERSYIAFERGTYWTKWRARNPFYYGRKLRVITGYLTEGGEYDPDNFQTRHYIIDSVDVSGGKCRMKGKDPLKLADDKKAQAPRASTGKLSADIAETDTSLVLQPAGVGDAEYPSGGFIRISSEVMGFTRSGDTLTITRGEYNTEISDHSADDTAQLCLLYDNQVNLILEDLLTEYAGIDSAFIPSAKWQSEANDYLRGNYTALITEPVGVKKLIKELGEQAPHSLYWDERSQTIEFAAVKPPPSGSRVLDDNKNIIAGSFNVSDKDDMRVNTVYVYFGQIDPTKKLDETNNYSQTYVRFDSDNAANYGSNEIKTIYSRWINRTSESQARVLAAKIGRRFGQTPRAISFALDPKDSSVWAGQSVNVKHRELTDFSGEPTEVTFQVLSVQESNTYKYKAIEYRYADALPEDEGGGEPGVDLLSLSGDAYNYSIREAYDNQVAVPPDENTKVKLIIYETATVGSISTSQPALTTGSWPAGAEVELEVRGRVLGKGGNAGDGDNVDGQDGGVAISMQYDMTLNNLGLIGGGAGGGGGARDSQLNPDAKVGGGGGAGRNAGDGGDSSYNGSGLIQITFGQDGDSEAGGNGGIVRWSDGGVIYEIRGGDGGNIGQSGNGGYADPSLLNSVIGLGGSAGNAITTNGNTITYTESGDIRGRVV